jgi:cytoskeletal protein RodZ
MNQTAVTPDATIIVLSYSGQTNPSDSVLVTTAQPDVNSTIQKLQNTVTTQQQAIAVLVSGSIAPTQATQEALADSQTPDPTENIGLTSSPSSRPKNLYPATNQQGIK